MDVLNNRNNGEPRVDLEEMLREREKIRRDLKAVELKAIKIIRSIIEKERKLFLIGNIEKIENFDEILKEYKDVVKRRIRVERKIERNVLGRKEEERLTKILYDLVKREEDLKRRIEEIKRKKKILEERKAILFAIKVEKRSFFRKIREIEQFKRRLRILDKKIKEKEKMLRGVTVYKEEVDISKIKEKYEEILKRVKNSKRIKLEDLKMLDEYEKLLKGKNY